MAERQRPQEERSSERSRTSESEQARTGRISGSAPVTSEQRTQTHEEGSRAEGMAEQMEEMKEKAKSRARELGHEAEERAERWTSSVGHQAESLARALRVASDSLWVEGEERMASVVEQAADQVDRMSGYLEDEDPAGMLDDLAELGRQNPGAFLGSAFAMGLAAGRFLRASSPNGGTRSDGRTREERERAARGGIGATAGAHTAPSGATQGRS